MYVLILNRVRIMAKLFNFILVITILVSGCIDKVKNETKYQMKELFINPEGLFKTNAYTQIVTTEGGRTIYISGQIPFNEKGELVGKDSLEAQINQVFKNINTALKSVRATFNDVVKVTYYIKNYNPEYLPLIREMRSKYFNKENPPSASLVGVQSLFIEDVLIEVEVVAHTN